MSLCLSHTKTHQSPIQAQCGLWLLPPVECFWVCVRVCVFMRESQANGQPLYASQRVPIIGHTCVWVFTWVQHSGLLLRDKFPTLPPWYHLSRPDVNWSDSHGANESFSQHKDVLTHNRNYKRTLCAYQITHVCHHRYHFFRCEGYIYIFIYLYNIYLLKHESYKKCKLMLLPI